MKYSIIFDTNVLFVNYDRGGDFTKFYFNSTFSNIINYIEKSDLYENFEILIPSVVWKEMKKQKIDAYFNKKQELESKINKIKIPEITVSKKNEIYDYEAYIEDKITEYKQELKNSIIEIKEISLPTKDVFESIVQRAFNKLPPFEGQNKKSDKGFKDVLLWESILQYKQNNINNQIVFYSNDNIFKEYLENEFQSIFKEKIEITKNEEEILKILKQISNINDKYLYIKDDITELEEIRKYLVSKVFREKLLEALISINIYNDVYTIEVINNINVQNIVPRDIENVRYYDAKLEFNVLFNKINGEVEDIIEKRECINISFVYNENKIENISYDYKNLSFDEG